MAALYDALVAKVRDWSNRDAETLADGIIQDALRYAADQAYRELRIPSLEATATYTITNAQDGTNSLTIPDDLSEFISLRRTSGTGISSSSGQTLGNHGNTIVYNEKLDYRTFSDNTAFATDLYRWTRRQNQIMVAPALMEDEVYELFYYRRLPALNARYSVTATNGNAGRLVAPTGTQVGTNIFFDEDTNTYYDSADDVPAGAMVTTVMRIGNEAPNWLRDEQEKVLLWGSLYHIFDYLGEDQMAQKYLQKFTLEIERLNNEENHRKASGGNVQQNFDGFLI